MTQVEKRQKWTTLVAKQMASGQIASLWCRENQISYTLFQYWNKRLKQLASQEEDRSASIILDLGNGLQLEIRPGFDVNTLRQVLSTLREHGHHPALLAARQRARNKVAAPASRTGLQPKIVS